MSSSLLSITRPRWNKTSELVSLAKGGKSVATPWTDRGAEIPGVSCARNDGKPAERTLGDIKDAMAAIFEIARQFTRGASLK